MRRSLLLAPIAAMVASLATVGAARAGTTVTFDTGSIIIPMDVDYQDAGMLKAFGLLDTLLRAGTPVQWCIKDAKVVVDASKGRFEDDFTATATDLSSGAAIASHGYRGGPFVIRAADATPGVVQLIKNWQAANTTTVHVASAPFSAFVSRSLSAAPRIAVMNDGNQAIAFSYLNAAGIPDEKGLSWTNTSVDLLTPTQVAGPTTTNSQDGALFGASGQPAFCEIMTMHWSVTSTDIPAVVPELQSFLQYPVHVNAECQAVNAIEGAPPAGGRANFVASQGLQWPAPAQPSAVQFSNSSLPFAQMDGPFGTIGGSEPAYALGPGSVYYDTGIVMVRAAGQPIGVQDIWMTAYAGMSCSILQENCNIGGHQLGKVSYLGGHQYTVKTPISTNAQTQGARLFLNSLYEAGCVTGEGQPAISVTKTAPALTTSSTVTYTLAYANTGPGPARSVVLTDPLPAGTSFVSATGGGSLSGGVVTWNVGDVGSGASGSVTVTVQLGAKNVAYTNAAQAAFLVGLNSKTAPSNGVVTTWVDCATDADCGAADSGTVCDATSYTCVSGCRGTGGNGCTAPLVCTSTDGTIGTCVAATDAGVDATTEASTGDTGDDTSSDGATSDVGGDTTSASDVATSDVGGDTTSASDVATSDVGDDTASASDGAISDVGDDTASASDGAISDVGDDTASASDDAAGDVTSNDTTAAGQQGGCGCELPGDTRPTRAAPILALAALGLALRARRRR